jgi:CheY-like chemotaxis protein
LAPAVLHGRSVMIVDENATNRLTLRLQLERWGMTVTEAGSGHDAIASMHSRRRFDVAMLDMQMPKMDGHELAIALRATPAGRAVPLILLSSPQGRLALPHPDLFAATLTKPVRGGRLEESLVQALTPQVGTSPPVSAPAVPRLTGRRPLRVLLVEDNAVNQRLGRLMVEKLGDHVDVVGDGREATEAVFLVPYDVVLMDVEMPVMDGLEATRIIRRDLSADRPLQIIAMTASALVEDRRACYDAGTDDYLAKPVRLADLDAALVNAAARLQRPPASLATKPPPSTAG